MKETKHKNAQKSNNKPHFGDFFCNLHFLYLLRYKCTIIVDPDAFIRVKFKNHIVNAMHATFTCTDTILKTVHKKWDIVSNVGKSPEHLRALQTSVPSYDLVLGYASVCSRLSIQDLYLKSM